MKNKVTKLPALPLITHDPFFSIWDANETPTAGHTTHWTGAAADLYGVILIDGVRYKFLGRGGCPAMTRTETNLTPLSTEYVYEHAGVKLTAKFTSPLLLDDLDILSTPVSYVDFAVDFIDGKEHEVKLRVHPAHNLCYNGNQPPRMREGAFVAGDLQFAHLEQAKQAPLSGSGDITTIDWGYLFFATADGIVNVEGGIHYEKSGNAPFTSTLMIGYDDIASINYFGALLPAYYARNGKTIVDAIAEFYARASEIKERCAKFDAQLLADADRIGGEDYQLIVCASYRQSIAAHKLVADPAGDILFISKENDSNGCAGTVDVSYPSIPLYLLYAPELVRGMCRPIFKFTRMPVWKYDFAPHDVGRYPIINGQVYGQQIGGPFMCGVTSLPYYLYPDTVDAFKFESQMPVEECGNMLLMLAAVGKADGNYDMAKENLDILYQWCEYLLKYGEDPGHQLCTDDFAGHLARNVNLSAKAVMGIAAFADILDALGEDGSEYRAKAKAMGQSWLERSDMGGYTALTFDRVGWSQKYNLVWDKLMGWNILPDEFYKKEIASYLPRINEYGLPLDSRCSYTKSDWTMWVSAMADDKQTRQAFMAPLAKFLHDRKSNVPFSDFYDTVTGTYEAFIGRSVQGGNFMPLLMEKWSK